MKLLDIFKPSVVLRTPELIINALIYSVSVFGFRLPTHNLCSGGSTDREEPIDMHDIHTKLRSDLDRRRNRHGQIPLEKLTTRLTTNLADPSKQFDKPSILYGVYS